jgi:hypothetical protein
MPSWRAHAEEHWWLLHDVVIASDPYPRGSRFEVYLYGKNKAIRHSLPEAKDVIEKEFGPQVWKREKLPLVVVNHPHWGPTTEFSDPTTIHWTELGKA